MSNLAISQGGSVRPSMATQIVQDNYGLGARASDPIILEMFDSFPKLSLGGIFIFYGKKRFKRAIRLKVQMISDM